MKREAQRAGGGGMEELEAWPGRTDEHAPRPFARAIGPPLEQPLARARLFMRRSVVLEVLGQGQLMREDHRAAEELGLGPEALAAMHAEISTEWQQARVARGDTVIWHKTTAVTAGLQCEFLRNESQW